MVLRSFPPMGVYETLFKFQDATGQYMGDPGTHPWAQGFPLTTKLPDGPDIPLSVEFTSVDLKYPAATGVQPLRDALAKYYNHFYGSQITADNVALFAGGRPGIYATLMFLESDVSVLIEETEYTPYYDKLKNLGRSHQIVPSNVENRFRPTLADYKAARKKAGGRTLVVRSNPLNPTGVTWEGEQLKGLVDFASESGHGALFDEAYEFFHKGGPVSAMKYVKNIDQTDVFVVGAATKGLQAPGARVGWVIASKKNIELFRNFSSIGMGGISRLSQIFVTKLLEIDRATKARHAVVKFYDEQRQRYKQAFEAMDVELFTGDGGFYHWGKLPGRLTAEEFNHRLFKHKAAILPGTLCDMLRRGDKGPHGHFMRFSFGPLEAKTFDGNVAIIKKCLS